VLELALKAKLPLIRVTTDDTLNVEAVLSHIIGKDFQPYTWPMAHGYVWSLGDAGHPYEEIYKFCAENGRTCVVVNGESNPLLFDAGRVPVPRSMAKEILNQVVPPASMDTVIAAMGGLPLKDIAEVAKLSMVQYQELTPQSIARVRRMYTARTPGLEQVDLDYPFYDVPDNLLEWVVTNAGLFNDPDMDQRLVPRGLLFNGSTGTGKTMGAKYLARELGVPLFKLDLGPILNKYLGDSEKNFSAALNEIDSAEPCALLIDEAEKVLRTQDDHPVASRILSSLLWWMQEHKTRVITLMTTNSHEDLPPELIRPGRIDEMLTFKGLEHKQSIFQFASSVADSLRNAVRLNHSSVHTYIEGRFLEQHPRTTVQAGIGDHWHMTQMEVTKGVFDLAKAELQRGRAGA